MLLNYCLLKSSKGYFKASQYSIAGIIPAVPYAGSAWLFKFQMSSAVHFPEVKMASPPLPHATDATFLDGVWMWMCAWYMQKQPSIPLSVW